HLARELHDEMGQCLTAIQADAESIKDSAPKDKTRIITSADAILKVSTHIYDVVHSMMHRLRPSVLDNLGLEEALKEEIYAWSARNPKVDCSYEFDGDLSRLGEHTNISIYRIIQECLTNISKHACAKNINIKLKSSAENLNLSIIDDGVGMDKKSHENEPSLGLGLIGMRERIQALNGVFFYEAPADDGFHIYIRIPHDADNLTAENSQ
ncbi:MAG: methanol utilization protein MoxY, partial [Gammaproteobacteria bacterium]|nr:methanol utilization protein MoxY [Gammaproteobacteria bacterium]